MSQNAFNISTTGTLSGLTLVQDINAMTQALASTSKGPTRPATVYDGQLWVDDHASPWVLKMASGSNDIPIGTVDPSGLIFALSTGAQSTSNRNRLINGDFQIDQNNLGASTAIANDTYCLDRWFALTQTASILVSQQTLQENGQPTNIRLTQNQAAAQRMGIAQIVPADMSQPDRGLAAVLKQRVRVSISQAIGFAVLAWTGTADTVTSNIVNNWTNGTYTAGQFFLGSNLTVVAVGASTPAADGNFHDSPLVTGTAPATLNNWIVFTWTQAAAAQNFTLDIGLAQLEPGSVATTFERRPLGQSLALCQRFFYKRVAVSSNDFITLSQAFSSSGAWGGLIPFPVEMRAVPTVSSSVAATLSMARPDGSAYVACSVVSTWVSSRWGTWQLGMYQSASTFWAPGQAVGIYFNSTSGFIAASAEL